MGSRFLFLYIYGINSQDLHALINALKLPVIITREIQYADAILALGNLMKNNKKLRQISNSRNIRIYTIPNNGLVQISKALKQIIERNLTPSNLKKNISIKDASSFLLTPLEEVRLMIEEVVIPDKQIVELFPRPFTIRRLQYEMINHYNLNSTESNFSIRIYP